MKLGLSSYTFGWAVGLSADDYPLIPLDALKLLDMTHRHGLHLVQVGDNLPLHRMGEERLHLFKEKAKELGIKIETGARKLSEENLDLYIKLSTKLDAEILRFVVDGENYEPDLDRVTGIIKNFVPALEKAGVTLGLENHDRIKARDFSAVVESIGSDRVGICLDSVNSMGAGEGLEQIVETLAPFTVNLHIKDFGIQRLPHLMGFRIDGRPAGKGMLNLPWLLEKISVHSKCRTAILEQWVVPEGEMKATVDKEKKWAEESLQYLKPFFEF